MGIHVERSGGLCHKCFKSGSKVSVLKGNILCDECRA